MCISLFFGFNPIVSFPHIPALSPRYASCKYLDNLHTSGNEHGRAFRDLEWEERIHKMTQKMGIGAQFGGK